MCRVWEWVYETKGSDGEIVDVDHSDSLSVLPFEGLDVAIRLDDGHKYFYGYISGGCLPKTTIDAFGADGPAIPKRFFRQLEKATEAK